MQTQSNKIDFKGQKIFAGFDVHLKSWKVTIEDHGLVRLRTTKVNDLARYKCRIKSRLYFHGI